jgi:hypothetical protein
MLEERMESPFKPVVDEAQMPSEEAISEPHEATPCVEPGMTDLKEAVVEDMETENPNETENAEKSGKS